MFIGAMAASAVLVLSILLMLRCPSLLVAVVLAFGVLNVLISKTAPFNKPKQSVDS
jgi:hypothetical protein